MSIKLMSLVWDSAPFQGARLLLLLKLADFANDEGWCWPSLAALAHACRIDRRKAKRLMRDLEGSGWLKLKPGGGRMTSRYQVLTGGSLAPSEGAAKPPQQGPQSPPSRGFKAPSEGAAKPPGTVTDPSGEGERASPAPLVLKGPGAEGEEGESKKERLHRELRRILEIAKAAMWMGKKDLFPEWLRVVSGYPPAWIHEIMKIIASRHGSTEGLLPSDLRRALKSNKSTYECWRDERAAR